MFDKSREEKRGAEIKSIDEGLNQAIARFKLGELVTKEYALGFYGRIVKLRDALDPRTDALFEKYGKLIDLILSH